MAELTRSGANAHHWPRQAAVKPAFRAAYGQPGVHDTNKGGQLTQPLPSKRGRGKMRRRSY